ncbi:tRNA-dependent cyclodipeptide synthase [Streptomyces noursei]
MLSGLVPVLDHSMREEILGNRGRKIRQRGEHALIGISAGNSYFSQKNVTMLLQWAGQHFERTDVVYVDTHIDDMLMADGRSAQEAEKSVKRTLKDLRRRLRRSLESVGDHSERIRVRSLSELQETPEYRAARESTDRAFREDGEFATVCEEMVRAVVMNRPGDGVGISEEHLRAGLNYVLAEAPLFADSPGVFSVPSSVLCYHIPTPVSTFLAHRETGFQAAQGQAYVVVRPQELADAA